MFTRLSLSLLLTGTAGWVDAIGFTRLGTFYPSFMSGNTTQLGVALSKYEWNLVVIAATILGLFFLGSFCGGLASALKPDWRLPVVLIAEIGLLIAAVGLASIFGRDHEGVLLLPVAMGIQNAATENLRQSAGGATFVTGTLFRAGHELAKALVGKARAAWFPQLSAWMSFALGAGAGALGNARWGILALSIPLVILAASAIVAIFIRHQTNEVDQ